MKRVSVRDIPGIGRGVFAEESIAAGEVIASDPVVELGEHEKAAFEKTRLRDYQFDWPGGLAVVFGVGSMMNHAYVPNAEYRADPAARRMVFIAAKDIVPGEEIRFEYGRDSYPHDWK